MSTMLSTMRRSVRTLSDSDNEDMRDVKRIADLSDTDEDMPPLESDVESDEDGPCLASSSSSTLAPISSRYVATLSDSEDSEGCCDDCDNCDDLVQEVHHLQ